MPRKSDAKMRMIETAAILFRAKGYHAVGLTEILAESGAPKGSFYHHFPEGKEQLAGAVIESSGAYILHLIDKAFVDAVNPYQAVEAFVDTIVETFKRSDFQLGCPVTSFIIEMTPANEDIRSQIENVLESWVQRMLFHTKRFEATRTASLETAFRMQLAAIEGAWLIARANKSVEPILMTKQLFPRMFVIEN